MSPEKVTQSLQRAEEFYAGRLSAHDFLMELDPNVLQPIARASAVMVFTRRQQLLKYAGESQ
jgi:4'-phosphopantetheinyl transferase EntD